MSSGSPAARGRRGRTNRSPRRVAALAAFVVGAGIAVCASGAEPDGWFGISMDVDGGGFFLNPTLRAASVTAVAPGSPAEVQGIRKGDAIIEFEGVAVAGAKVKELQAKLAKRVGETLRMKLRHPGGEIYTAVMVAVPRPPG